MMDGLCTLLAKKSRGNAPHLYEIDHMVFQHTVYSFLAGRWLKEICSSKLTSVCQCLVLSRDKEEIINF